MFRSPLSDACCAGLADNELLLLASCRKDAGVLALLVARKRLAIEFALAIDFSGCLHDVTIVTTWRTWLVMSVGIPDARRLNARRFVKPYARACFITELGGPHRSMVHWTFDVTRERLMLALKDQSFICDVNPGGNVTCVVTAEADALKVARLILEKC